MPPFEAGARFTNGFSIAIQIRWRFRFALTSILIQLSLQNCVHGTTAVLSWHVQKVVAILWTSNGIMARISFHRIWIAGKKTLVKRAPDRFNPVRQCIESHINQLLLKHPTHLRYEHQPVSQHIAPRQHRDYLCCCSLYLCINPIFDHCDNHLSGINTHNSMLVPTRRKWHTKH